MATRGRRTPHSKQEAPRHIEEIRLMLLGSPPDMVRGSRLRGTHFSSWGNDGPVPYSHSPHRRNSPLL